MKQAHWMFRRGPLLAAEDEGGGSGNADSGSSDANANVDPGAGAAGATKDRKYSAEEVSRIVQDRLDRQAKKLTGQRERAPQHDDDPVAAYERAEENFRQAASRKKQSPQGAYNPGDGLSKAVEALIGLQIAQMKPPTVQAPPTMTLSPSEKLATDATTLTGEDIDALYAEHGEDKANVMIKDNVNRVLRGVKLVADPKKIEFGHPSRRFRGGR